MCICPYVYSVYMYIICVHACILMCGGSNGQLSICTFYVCVSTQICVCYDDMCTCICTCTDVWEDVVCVYIC